MERENAFCGRKRKHKFHIVQALLAVTLLLLLSFVQNANAKEQENGEEIYETEIGELEQSTEETEDTEDVDNTEENKIAFFFTDLWKWHDFTGQL